MVNSFGIKLSITHLSLLFWNRKGLEETRCRNFAQRRSQWFVVGTINHNNQPREINRIINTPATLTGNLIVDFLSLNVWSLN